MAFLTEPAPPHSTPLPVAPFITRMVAPNPGPMTYHGTNSWLIAGDAGLTVIDPGPNEPTHIAALAAQGRIARILLTHTHPDHLAGAPALQAATGAPIHAWHTPWQQGFAPDIPLHQAQQIGPFTVLHTPGHASDHICFAYPGGILFSGDHVMSWNTSIVSPPDGDMAAYMAGLRLLLTREQDTLYLCGHGAPLPNPHPLVRAMLNHRAAREAAILAALAEAPQTEANLVRQLYTNLEPHLIQAAQRSVLAHLQKLQAEHKATQTPAGWASTHQA